MVKLFSWRKDVDKSVEWSTRKSFTISLKKDPEPAVDPELSADPEPAADSEPAAGQQPREEGER